MNVLRKLFERLWKFQLRLNSTRFLFKVRAIKLKAIQDIPVSKMEKKVRIFFGVSTI